MLAATFRFDATPPLGHPLCGGWVEPARRVESPLDGRGLILYGAIDPVVICALDWTGLCNGAYRTFCAALAEAAHTVPHRVVVHCVHQHDAPFVCTDAQRHVRRDPELPAVVDEAFFRRVVSRAAEAARAALKSARRVNEVGWAQASTSGIASNRRLVGLSGKVVRMRSVAPASDPLRQLPTGLVDETLRLVVLVDQRGCPICELWFFAVHPISVSGHGVVNHEFVGAARHVRQKALGQDALVLYFTGCAGNINAGKYISSAQPDCRKRLAERLSTAMRQAVGAIATVPVQRAMWQVESFLPPLRADLSTTSLARTIARQDLSTAARNRAAFALAFVERIRRREPLRVASLRLNDLACLFLPGEPFIEYQLWAVYEQPQRRVAVAGYCDGGPWYLPTKQAYSEGGYEVRVAWCAPEVDEMLRRAMLACLA